MDIEFHSHTNYSRDCLTTLEEYRKACIRKKLFPCITDHNTVEGALKYKKKFGRYSCIIGEEIKTNQGEVIGLFMQEEIKPFLGIQETLDRLKSQGVLVFVPHPFDRMRRSRLRGDILKLSKGRRIHFIETFNSRTVHDEDNMKAERFWKKNRSKFLPTVGSDAHTTYELGRSYIEFPEMSLDDIKDPKSFLQSFKNYSIHTRKSTRLVHVLTKIVKTMRSSDYLPK